MRSKTVAVIDGPTFGAIMNSLSAPQIADAYPLQFTLCFSPPADREVIDGKAVGIVCRDIDDKVVYGLRVQLTQRLLRYSPIKPDDVDVIFPVYNTRDRRGSCTVSLKALMALDLDPPSG